MGKTLSAVLNGHLTERDWSFEKLATEAGLPRNTVYRWTRGEVKRVRHWQDLAKAARALDLNRFQTNALLENGGHPSIEVLLTGLTDEKSLALLSTWTGSPPNNLPAPLTSFVGRDEELGYLTRLLSSARLVTLTGPGGSGKTRLALEVAQAVLDEFEEVTFIDLSSVRDPGLAILAISQTLGLNASIDEAPMLALKTYLRNRSMLLVLDNFEQVIEAAALLTELLGASQGAKALVTSRTRLNVRGEYEFVVLPLSLPLPASSFEELALNPSIALFTDRARAANSSFRLTPDNAQLVAEVCARLDGLPLGIELAAAKTRQMQLRAMLKRFSGSLALASEGLRDLPDRQQTLRATIAWSYNLLAREEQMLFTCLGLFAGGFTEEAVRSVYDTIGQLEIEVSRGLDSLAEQSLVRRAWNGEGAPRYEMLETIREYALEQLNQCSDAETVLEFAADYFAELAERADLEGVGQASWLPKMVAEQDNFRNVLGWYKDHGKTEAGLRLSVSLMPLWQLQDHQLEAHTWLETFMTNADMVPSGLKAKGLLWQGLLLMRGTDDYISASQFFEEALTLFRENEDLNGMSETLQAEGDVYRNQGHMDSARQRYTESLMLAEQAGNSYLGAHGYMGLALCAQEESQFEAAEHNWRLMLEWAEKAKNEASMALALNSLGEMARYREAWVEAEHYYKQTLRLGQELGNESRMALALHNLGYVALHTSDTRTAKRLFSESLFLYMKRPYLQGQAEWLAGLARVAALEDSHELAARLCGATEVILEGLGTQLDILDRIDFERTLGMLRSHLGERLQSLLDEGRAMSAENATAERKAITREKILAP